MGELDSYDVRPIKPMICPRCGKAVIFDGEDIIRCETCGELYYDNWLGIWRIQRTEAEED